MTRRIHQQQLSFAAGEVSESFASRYDGERRQAGARELTNFVVDEGGGLLPRGSIGSIGGEDPDSDRMAFIEGLFLDATGGYAPSFIMFPFRTRERENVGINGSKVESTPIEYMIVLHNVVSGETSQTCSVSKFTPSTGAFNTIGSIMIDNPGTLDPEWPRIGSRKITINAVQADDSLFIVSSSFPPHRFIESGNPDDTSGTVEQVQFYKDTVGLVRLERGSTSVSQYNFWTKTEFEWEFGPFGDLAQVRIGGIEYFIANIINDAQLELGSAWQPSGEVVDKIELVGSDPVGVQLQRRWPVTGGSNLNGASQNINDGTFRPRVVAFSQGRLILGSCLTHATQAGDDNLVGGNRIWVSRAGDPFTIMPAFKYTVPEDGAAITPSDAPIQVNLELDAGDAFEWAVGSTTQVYFGSTQSIYAMTNTQNGIDAGGLVGAVKISGVGAKDVPFTERDGNPIYIAQDSGGVMGARFDLLSQGFQRDDLTRHTKELASDLIDITYDAPKPNDRAERLWCVKEDGSAITGGIFPDEALVAWSRIEMSDMSGLSIHSVVALSSGVYAAIRKDGTSQGAIIRIDGSVFSPDSGEHEYAVDMPIDATQSVGTWSVADPIYFSKTVACLAKIDGEWSHLGPVEIDEVGDMVLLESGNIGYTVKEEVANPSPPPATITIDSEVVDYGIAWDDAAITDIIFAFPYDQRVKLFPKGSSDGRGFSIGRRSRIISLACDLVGTRQVAVEGRALFTNILDAGRDPRKRTDWFRRRFVGREADRTLTIESIAPYPVRLRAVVQEVSI